MYQIGLSGKKRLYATLNEILDITNTTYHYDNGIVAINARAPQLNSTGNMVGSSATNISLNSSVSDSFAKGQVFVSEIISEAFGIKLRGSDSFSDKLSCC